MSIRKRLLFFTYFLCLLLCATLTLSSPVRSEALPVNATSSMQDSYVMDGAAGPCSLDLTVTDATGKPVFAALINVHIAYRFGGFHTLDLSVYSNNEGHAKFIGLPEKVRKPPLEFRARKDEARGLAVYDPATDCHGKRDIVLQKPGS